MDANISNSVFIPTSTKEVRKMGWDYLDVILFTGDAYIDHPSFGIAIIARVLEDAGFRVAVVPQPNWRDDLRDFKKLGKPRLFFGVTAGNLDSMVANYTAAKRLRSDDSYSVDAKAGFRPDYASVVYSKILKQIFPDVPIVLGGIEASMRRFAHYDYWKNDVISSILELANADLLVYGMGEKTIRQIAEKINNDGHIFNCLKLKQIAYLTDYQDNNKDDITLFSYKEIKEDKIKYADNFVTIEKYSNFEHNCRLIQNLANSRLVVNPPLAPLSSNDLDAIYALPFTRKPHLRYAAKPQIPAFEMIKDSVTIHRGCFGGCSFCTISAHQGKHIVSRSEQSILCELENIAADKDFKGHVTDLGGPSANMYKMIGNNPEFCKKCSKPSCIFPEICKQLNTSHAALCKLYKKSLLINGIKKISIGSGIRYDIILYNIDNQIDKQEYLELLVSKFVSGRLKVAPEHCTEKVLKFIRKPCFDSFKILKKHFDHINQKFNLKQQIIPYFISSHPGCTEKDMAQLATITQEMNFKLEQVQQFTPTPMTLATTMYYCEMNPYTKEQIYVPKSKEENAKQLKYFFWYKK